MLTTQILPSPFDWSLIPAGSVRLEDFPESYSVAAFDMATYPITNAQFQVFVAAADGYTDPTWWDFAIKARRWRDRSEPYAVHFPGDNLPRTSVSWFEAVAFCHWLSAKTGENITLPTELEWQRAAQGDDGRKFPWGDAFEIHRLNASESGIKQPTPVTQYSEGSSPFGVMDMSGNVAEWCLNGAYIPDDSDISSFEGGEARAARGGSWGLSHLSALVAFRSFNHAGDRFDFQGFRLVRHS